MGEELGLSDGYSGAAISDWERGSSKILADDRNTLINLIRILHKAGGLETSADANSLLKAGNYRQLNASELSDIFSETSTIPKDTVRTATISTILTAILTAIGTLISAGLGLVSSLLQLKTVIPAEFLTLFAIVLSLVIILGSLFSVAVTFYRRESLQTKIAVEKLMNKESRIFQELEMDLSLLLKEKVR